MPQKLSAIDSRSIPEEIVFDRPVINCGRFSKRARVLEGCFAHEYSRAQPATDYATSFYQAAGLCLLTATLETLRLITRINRTAASQVILTPIITSNTQMIGSKTAAVTIA
jgi:hypothetical protein